MDWNRICDKIPEVISDVRREYILNNHIIKDDIFRILEKYCIVVYYPIADETKSRGFHIKRYLNGELKDFVYINTAKSTSEQVFAAAHELGHVWRVADKVWKMLDTDEELTGEIEEEIVGRFAAELLMPKKEFVLAFATHLREFGYNSTIRFEELIRVMVLQMSDFMVPYEAVRRRMIETGIFNDEAGKLLSADTHPEINEVVHAYLNDVNTALEESTDKKTIPGLRDLITKAECDDAVSEYLLNKIKKDFSIEEISSTDKIIKISVKDG
jgi:Zn-dependent peptidase ImmA (M78 family)